MCRNVFKIIKNRTKTNQTYENNKTDNLKMYEVHSSKRDKHLNLKN